VGRRREGLKTVGLLRKLHHRGSPLVNWTSTFHAAAYNLVRLRTLLARPHDRELARGDRNVAMNPAFGFEDNVGVLEVTFSGAC